MAAILVRRKLKSEICKFAAAQLDKSLCRVQKYLRQSARNWHEDAEHIHRLRIWTRRTLAVLVIVKKEIEPSDFAWFSRRLKRLRSIAGRARDLDVLICQTLKEECKSTDVLCPVLKKMRRKTQPAVANVYRAWKKELADRTDLMVKGLNRKQNRHKARSSKQFNEWAVGCIARCAGKFLKAIPNRQNPNVEEIHTLRIAAKKLRYSIETVQSVVTNVRIDELGKDLSLAQTYLGTLQDHAVACRLLSEARKQVKRRTQIVLVEELIAQHESAINEMVGQFEDWKNSISFQGLICQIQSLRFSQENEQSRTLA